MAVTTMSSREFDQDGAGPGSCLRRLPAADGGHDGIVDLLGMPPGVEDAELETPRLLDRARPADLP